MRGWVASSFQPLQFDDLSDSIEIKEGESLGVILLFKSPAPQATKISWELSDPNGRLASSSGIASVSAGATSLRLQLTALTNSTSDSDEEIEVFLSGSSIARTSFKLNVKDQTSVVIANLTNVPMSLNNQSSLNVLVGGASVTQYSYKIGVAASTDCTSSAGYSSSRSIAAAINDVLATDGSYKLCVVASNGSQWQTYTAATSTTWTLDTTGPAMASLTINGVTSGYTQSTSATLAPSAIDAYEMYITPVSGCGSGGAWEAYAISTSYTLTSNTNQTVYIKFRDTLTNESSCVSAQMVHDNQSPNSPASLALGSTPLGLSTAPFLNWSAASDVGPAGIDRYQARLLRVSDSTQIAPWQDFASGSALSSLSLADNTNYVYEIRAIDRAGNMSNTVQTIGFTTYSALLATMNGTPSITSSAASLNVDVGGVGVSHYAYKVGAATSINCTSATGYSSSISEAANITDSVAALPDGLLRLCVVGSNGSQWQSYASATFYDWTKDTTGPTVTLTSSSSSPTNVSPIPIVIQFSENLSTDLVGTDLQITNGTLGNFVKQSASQWTADITPSSSPGALTVSAQVLSGIRGDALGNLNPVSNTLNVTYDAFPPTLTIASPAANSEITVVNQSSFLVNGTCSENGRIVSVTGDAMGSTTCSAGLWSISLDFLTASIGTVSISVNHTKTSGASSTIARSFIKVANRAPSLATIADQTLLTNTALSTVNPNDMNSGSDTDIDGQSITYSCVYDQTVDSIVSPGTNCTSLSGLTFNTSTGVMNWTPTVAGVYEFKIIGSDGSLSNSKYFIVNAKDVIATLSAVPFALSADSNLKVVVGGYSIANYKFKLGPQSSTDCTASTGYSAPTYSVSTKITTLLTGYSIEQPLRLCVIGATSSLVWQSYAQATTHDWVKDSWTSVEFNSIATTINEGNSTSAQNLSFTITQPKPSAMTITYDVFGATAATDTNLISGSFTVPANATSYSLPFNVVGNNASDGNRRIWIRLTGSNRKFINFGSKQQKFIDILDDELSGVTYLQVSSGLYHTCAIVSGSGQLRCWGKNSDGQLGDGTTINRSTPIVIDGASSYSQVAVGDNHTCAIVSGSGVLKCWGNNSWNQLGDGTSTSRVSPTVIHAGTSYSQISAGALHSCGIVSVSGVLKCWGTNIWSQLGDGTTSSRTTPITIDSGVKYSSISAGYSHTCGIVDVSGELKCWGTNGSYQLGDGTNVDRNAPTPIDSGVSYSRVALKTSHTCAVTSVGALKCWGSNFSGQIGDGTTVPRSTPTPIDGSVSYADIAVGDSFSCGLTSAGETKCWGQNLYGQLGDGLATNRYTPALIDLGTTYSKLSLGNSHACGLTTTSLLKCWGLNLNSQLAEQFLSALSQSTVSQSSSNFSQLAVGEYFSCGIVSVSGELRCWGQNTSGQLGDGTTIRRTHPITVDGGTPYSRVAVGVSHACGIVSGTGSLRCWGTNGLGQLGDGSNTQRLNPVEADPGVAYSQVTTGESHSCGIVSGTNELRCWGGNSYGQLGRGNTTPTNVPVVIDPGVAYADVAAGEDFTCGIVLSDGTLKCWGYNNLGQLGDGTTTQRLSPTIIDSPNSYSKVAPGDVHACGILASSKKVRCWGFGSYGQVGDSSNSTRYLPVSVDSATNYLQIESGMYHTCGVVDGTNQVKCWGFNRQGQVGNGASVDSNVPTLISGSETYSNVQAGRNNSCAIQTASGQIRCWGGDEFGQNGFGGDASIPKLLF